MPYRAGQCANQTTDLTTGSSADCRIFCSPRYNHGMGATPRAVVTGGAGFIGSHLVDRLLQDGFKVTVLDNFVNGQRRNLEQHSGDDRLEIIDVDVARGDIAPYF